MIWERGWEEAAFAVACESNTNCQSIKIAKSSAEI